MSSRGRGIQTSGLWFATALVLAAGATGAEEAPAGEPAPLPSIAKATRGLERHEGLFVVHLDRQRGRVLFELGPGNPTGQLADVIVLQGLRQGLGSNPVGLDRGQLSGGQLLRLRRVGDKVLAELPNLAFRATSDDFDEHQAVAESFAGSVIWAGPIAAIESDGRVLVDATSLVVRDAHGIAARLKQTGQGAFELDLTRSALDSTATKVFPRNIELEAVLTFGGHEPGDEVKKTVPFAEAVTLVQHLSLIALPPPGYRPRPFDPRMGSFGLQFADYASPLAAPLQQHWIARHRLEKVNPAATRSTVREPIVYYVDRGAPEPIRSALLDGARWWATAFEAAGLENAYRVEVMPEGADPLDVRYNVIQWVHRSTRGWSYGEGVTDPRTGEIIKGHVSLGSLRVRQDILLFEGLIGTAATGQGGPNDPVEVALARIRQLAAHEVGHTLGFNHNFAASTFANRASVMDYPAPRVTLAPDGSLDLSDAYGIGVGDWDVHQTRWAYGEPPPGTSEDTFLTGLVGEGLARGYLFLGDADARPLGGAQPKANLWDNGEDPAIELEHVLAVRAKALAHFGPDRLAAGRSTALYEEVLAPLYFHHRYQLEAAAKVVAGIDYRHAVVGDGQPTPRPIPAAQQRRALEVLLTALDPATLDLPDHVLALLAPRAPDSERHPELFSGQADPGFDVLAAATTAADLVFAVLLDQARVTRLIEQNRRDGALPSLESMLNAVSGTTFSATAVSARQAEVRRAIQWLWVDRLVAVAETAPRAVAGRAEQALLDIADRIRNHPGVDAAAQAHRRALIRDLELFFSRREWRASPSTAPPPPPPGSPIGHACGWSGPLG